jgi:hypothetical protein
MATKNKKVDLPDNKEVFSFCRIFNASYKAGIILFVSLSFFFSTHLWAQQLPDANYNPRIENPAYEIGKGPVIFIDEGHHNFHTKDGRYSPFARVLENDGYVIKASKELFDDEKLREYTLLVIANPLNEINIDNWTLPNPSAFTDQEINSLEKWVREGGSLFLIVDHMPWPGASAKLAQAFGFEFLNGFNINIVNPAFFWRENNTITDNSITSGRDSSEMIHRIPMTEGQAFKIPSDAEPILIFDNASLILLPETAWEFTSDTPKINIEGLSQGAYKKHGKGRIVVFGEASMFSAQIGDPGRRKMGMNSDHAMDNYKLLLNIIHWLDGLLD